MIIRKSSAANSAENIPQNLAPIRASQTSRLFSKPGLADIRAIGFRQIGTWLIENGNLALRQNQMRKASPALYSFILNGQVMYVGKTSQLLAKRLYFYAKPGSSQSTNIRLNALLSHSLSNGNSVEIFGYADTSAKKIGIFDLDTAAGLENSIISQLQPCWNIQK